jgi:hypothetical protein
MYAAVSPLADQGYSYEFPALPDIRNGRKFSRQLAQQP